MLRLLTVLLPAKLLLMMPMLLLLTVLLPAKLVRMMPMLLLLTALLPAKLLLMMPVMPVMPVMPELLPLMILVLLLLHYSLPVIWRRIPAKSPQWRRLVVLNQRHLPCSLFAVWSVCYLQPSFALMPLC
jgi:hypothetical protein